MSVDIVIPVHDSPDDVRRCIGSCLASLRPGDRIVVVDDGSAAETETLCRDAAARHPGRVHLVRRSEGSGFPRAANAGIRETGAPIVVLLNSDTVVPVNWLERIEACFAASPEIGIVGPLSNAGGWQSIPRVVQGGPKNNRVVSDSAAIEDMQAYCETFRRAHDYPLVEQLNGFCLAVRRAVFDAIGLLDEVSFPMGYGEEVDFNFRSQYAGFLSAVAIDCFVYHDKTKSYTSAARKKLVAEGRARNERVHGAGPVRDAMRGTRDNPILAAIRDEAAWTFAERGWSLDGAEGRSLWRRIRGRG